MSTSSELDRPTSPSGPRSLTLPELREGEWTRLGPDNVLGDPVTEALLGSLAESTRRAARAQGYAVGWAEGRRAAEAAAAAAALESATRAAEDRQRHEQEHRAALDALQTLAAQLQSAFAEACRSVDAQAAGLALELTRELVGTAAAEAGARAIDRVRDLLPEHEVVRVRLHPDVAANAADLAGAGIRVIADPTLGRSDALAETDLGVLDLRVPAALERLREVLA